MATRHPISLANRAVLAWPAAHVKAIVPPRDLRGSTTEIHQSYGKAEILAENVRWITSGLSLEDIPYQQGETWEHVFAVEPIVNREDTYVFH